MYLYTISGINELERARETSYRALDDCSTVCNVVGLFVSFRSTPLVARVVPALGTDSALDVSSDSCRVLSISLLHRNRIGCS